MFAREAEKVLENAGKLGLAVGGEYVMAVMLTQACGSLRAGDRARAREYLGALGGELGEMGTGGK